MGSSDHTRPGGHSELLHQGTKVLVTDLIRHSGPHTMVRITLADGTSFDATDRHPFWNEGTGQWVDAITLQAGDHLLDVQGEPITVTDVQVSNRDLRAYNLTVDQLHTYHVGATPILVHNCGPGSAGSFAGGRYSALGKGSGIEAHHMPADSVSPLSRGRGPAIQMEKADHMITASWGSSSRAKSYRAQQRALIDQGRFDDAVQMDIDDVTSKFGIKYDSAILDMIGSLE